MGVMRLPLDKPPEMEEVVDGTGKLEGAGGAEAVDLSSCLEKPREVRVVEVGYRDDEPPEAAFLAFQPYSYCKPSFLHLRPLLLLHRCLARSLARPEVGWG
ncbi:unnamed protein product, partial [Musa hybrid cultivar]